jgi:hypothetical protein
VKRLVLLSVLLAGVAALFLATGALRPAQAQAGSFFGPPSGSCCGQVNFGRTSNPPVTPVTPRRYGTGGSYRQPLPHANGHASGCDSLCQSKCQGAWRALGFRSVNACVVRWAKLNAEGTAATCETAIKANGMRPIRGC